MIDKRLINRIFVYLKENPNITQEEFIDNIVQISSMSKEQIVQWFDIFIEALVQSLVIMEPSYNSLKEKIISLDDTMLETVINGDAITFIKNIEGGKWEITSNQLICYDVAGTSVVATFNLYDSSGSPSMTEVYKRERV